MIACRACGKEPAAPSGDVVYDAGRRETRYPVCPLCHAWVKKFLDDLDALPEASAKDRMVRG